MHVLAFETCLDSLSVAAGRLEAGAATVLAECREDVSAGHAERLLPMIADVMARSGLAFRDLGRIAVTLGPGTFTGVRTGIAAARAFRLAAGLEIVGIPSLTLLAAASIARLGPEGKGRAILVAVDARRGRVYAALFAAASLEPLSPIREATPVEAAALADGLPALAVGSGAHLVCEAAPVGAQIDCLDRQPAPTATDLLHLAGRLLPLRDVVPLYVRPPDAKPQTAKSLARTP